MFITLFFITATLFGLAQYIDNQTERTQPAGLLYALPVTLLVLMYGLRDGWMIDFTIYEYSYRVIGTDVQYEPGFVLLQQLLRRCGFSFNGALCIYTIFPVVGYMLFAMLRRKQAGVIMILFMTMSVSLIANNIRWSLASGWIFTSIALLDHKKYIWAVVCAVTASLFHLMIAPVTIILWILYFFPVLKNRYVALFLCFASVAVSPALIAQMLMNMATGVIDSGGVESDLTFSNYLSDENVADKYFAGERSEMFNTLSFKQILRSLILFCWLLWEGAEMIKEKYNKSRLLKMCYCMVAIYAFTFFPTWGIELALRYVALFALGVPVLATAILYWEIKENRYLFAFIGAALLALNFILMYIPLTKEYVLKYIPI